MPPPNVELAQLSADLGEVPSSEHAKRLGHIEVGPVLGGGPDRRAQVLLVSFVMAGWLPAVGCRPPCGQRGGAGAGAATGDNAVVGRAVSEGTGAGAAWASAARA